MKDFKPHSTIFLSFISQRSVLFYSILLEEAADFSRDIKTNIQESYNGHQNYKNKIITINVNFIILLFFLKKLNIPLMNKIVNFIFVKLFFVFKIDHSNIFYV